MKRITFVAAAALLTAGSTLRAQQATKHDTATKHAPATAKPAVTHDVKVVAPKTEGKVVKHVEKPVTTAGKPAATHAKTATKTTAKPDSVAKKKTP